MRREWPSGQSAGLWVGRPRFESWMGHYVVALSKSLHSPCFVFSDKTLSRRSRLLQGFGVGDVNCRVFNLFETVPSCRAFSHCVSFKEVSRAGMKRPMVLLLNLSGIGCCSTGKWQHSLIHKASINKHLSGFLNKISASRVRVAKTMRGVLR